MFWSLAQARVVISDWKADYNHRRRHSALGYQAPAVYAAARAGHDLAAVDPHGPHDLRHTFSTWLEDAGIPARVIDELMGHERSRRGELEGGSRIGARYRHTTPEMAVRVGAAVQERMVVVVQVAGATLQADDSGGRVFEVVRSCLTVERSSALRRDKPLEEPARVASSRPSLEWPCDSWLSEKWGARTV